MSTRTTTFQPSQPTEASLREAALRHLARYATTSTGLTRVLDRRIDRWLRAAQTLAPEDDALPETARQARTAARQVVARLVELNVLNDAAYADSRARAMAMAGKSRRKIVQTLAIKGIDQDMMRTLPENPEQDLAAALLLLRKRKLGPDSDRLRALGILARAGFSHDTATQALSTDPEEADQQIIRMRRGEG